MSYRIIYDSECFHNSSKSKFFRLIMTASFFVFFIWTVNVCWPEGRNLLKLLIIPGDPDVTLEAAEMFAQELHSGSSFVAAWDTFSETVFCHGIAG